MFDVVKHPFVRNGEILDGVGHPRAVRIANADDFRVRMLVRLAQEVAHVNVLKTDSDDPLLTHFPSRLLMASQSREIVARIAAEKAAQMPADRCDHWRGRQIGAEDCPDAEDGAGQSRKVLTGNFRPSR